MTTLTSDSDHWYDPDGTDAATLQRVREVGTYQQSDPSTDRRERLHKFEIDRAFARIAELETQVHQRALQMARDAEHIAQLEAEQNSRDIWETATVKAAILAEREACERIGRDDPFLTGLGVADRIRARPTP